MKFKIGDKVKVVKVVSAYGSEQKKYIGKTFTMASVRENSNFSYDFKESTPYWWCDEELELVSFTKADLKDGMVVEYCDGSRRMVVNGKVLGFDCFMPLDNWNEDLINNDSDRYTIVKVYISTQYSLNRYFDDEYLTLIWEREKPIKKMTVAEIEKELGYKVEIVFED
jgi:hypothetical protein